MARQQGFSLVMAMIAMMIISLGVAASMRLMGDMSKSSQSATSVVDLIGVKLSVVQQVDCAQSLGVTSATTLPLACGSYANVTLRKTNGGVLGNPVSGWQEMGNSHFNWKIQAYCHNDAIRIRVRSKSPDPVLKEIVNKSDLFDGGVDLCAQYFVADPCPPSQISLGSAGGVPTCINKGIVVNMGLPTTYSIAAPPSSTQTVSAGLCALVNVEYSHFHRSTGSTASVNPGAGGMAHSHAISNLSSNSTGVDCQVFQQGVGTFQLFGSTRALPGNHQSVLCQFTCWPFY